MSKAKVNLDHTVEYTNADGVKVLATEGQIVDFVKPEELKAYVSLGAVTEITVAAPVSAPSKDK